MNGGQLHERIFSVDEKSFDSLALEIFRFQFEHNPVYAAFAKGIGRTPETVKDISSIPFLPVELFKTHKIYAADKEPEIVFTSSGTSGQIQSKHYVADVSLYEKSFRKGFELFYGDIKNYAVFALLPSYLERGGSSLVYMFNQLISESKNPDSGFYLHDYAELSRNISRLNAEGKKIMLIGVTYALLDLAEKFPQQLRNCVIMETGGMKGKRKEMVREGLHGILKNSFEANQIHSEYGMTELLSQAYSKGNGIFNCPPWMKIKIREMNDPLSYAATGKTGGVNIIDLANLYSCSFISTSDLGKLHEDGSFEILGRFDNSDVRGCNLMVE
ncbi:MAG: acyl transferase [Bacteroidota bacterium]|nr:acyl transferase [Bacteroidota bacterium]